MLPPVIIALFFIIQKVRPVTILYIAVVAALVYAWWQWRNPPTTTKSQPQPQPLDFLKRIDPERYRKINEKIHAFDKTYKYILGERRPCHMGIADLFQQREEAIELIETSIHTFPANFKHIYGRDPDQELAEMLTEFRTSSRKKLDTVHNYCSRLHKDIPYRSPVISPASQR